MFQTNKFKNLDIDPKIKGYLGSATTIRIIKPLWSDMTA